MPLVHAFDILVEAGAAESVDLCGGDSGAFCTCFPQGSANSVTLMAFADASLAQLLGRWRLDCSACARGPVRLELQNSGSQNWTVFRAQTLGCSAQLVFGYAPPVPVPPPRRLSTAQIEAVAISLGGAFVAGVVIAAVVSLRRRAPAQPSLGAPAAKPPQLRRGRHIGAMVTVNAH